MSDKQSTETLKERRVAITITLDESLVRWIEARADANRRARCREIEVLLEGAKRRTEGYVPRAGIATPEEAGK